MTIKYVLTVDTNDGVEFEKMLNTNDFYAFSRVPMDSLTQFVFENLDQREIADLTKLQSEFNNE